MQHDNIVSFGNTAASRRPTLDEKSRRVVDMCRMAYVKMLPALLTSLFEKLDDSLYELSDKSESDTQQTSYFDAMREMRKERIRIEKQFKEKISVEYDRFWSHGPDNKQTTSQDDEYLSTELSLLDEDGLEETLAVTSLISKGENRYQRDLEALNERFGHILKSVDVTHQNNPVSPAMISNLFHDLMEPVSVDLPIKLVIYKLFDKFVMHYVGGIYDEINLLLRKEGVLPKLTQKVRRNPVVASAKNRHDGKSAPQSADDGMVNSDVQSEVFNAIQSLLTNRNTGGTVALGGPIDGISLPAVDTVELVDALSMLQTRNITLINHTELGSGQQDLRQVLVKSLQLESDGELNKTLGKADNDTIDVVSMLFEYILDDNNLPDPMKALIGRLQIPMLKVALADKSFFSKKVHPARRLLNNMARAAVGWNDNGERSPKSLYGVIEGMIRRILNEFERDATLFEQLNEEFSAFFENESRGAEVAEKRTNQVVRGKEQLSVAKMRISDEINNRLGVRRQVPEVAHTLLNDGWKDVLLLIYLRKGIDSDAWSKGLDTMDALLWSVEPKTESTDRKELLKKIPDLLRTLREGLAEISYDQHKMARLFKELQQCHILCMKGRMGAVKMVKTEPVKCSKPDTPPVKQASHHLKCSTEEIVLDSTVSPHSQSLEDEPVDLPMAKQDDFFDQASAIKVGTWLEVAGESEEKSRIKLSWKSDVTNTFVFVDRRGVKVREMTVETLAALLREGVATILKDTKEPLMDRALNAMMDALKKTGASATAS